MFCLFPVDFEHFCLWLRTCHNGKRASVCWERDGAVLYPLPIFWLSSLPSPSSLLPLTSSCPSPFPPLIFLMTSRCDCWPWLQGPHPEDAGSVPPQTWDQRLRWGCRGGCNPSTTSGDEEKENFEVLWIKPVNNNSRWSLTGSHSKKGKWFFANCFPGPSGFLWIPFNLMIESPRPVIHGRVPSQK